MITRASDILSVEQNVRFVGIVRGLTAILFEEVRHPALLSKERAFSGELSHIAVELTALTNESWPSKS